jgi:hypothetical protein
MSTSFFSLGTTSEGGSANGSIVASQYNFCQSGEDTLRGPVLESLPFYDQKKVVALLDRLPGMSNSDRVGWDPTLMSILSACIVQERFALGSKTAGRDAFPVSVRLTPSGGEAWFLAK